MIEKTSQLGKDFEFRINVSQGFPSTWKRPLGVLRDYSACLPSISVHGTASNEFYMYRACARHASVVISLDDTSALYSRLHHVWFPAKCV